VNDLAEQGDALMGKDLAGGVGEIDGPFHPVAEAEFLGQSDDRISLPHDSALGADAFDGFAPVVAFHLSLHPGHDLRSAEVYPFPDDGSGHSAMISACFRPEKYLGDVAQRDKTDRN